MKTYFGYDKPYLYVYCPAGSTETMEQALTPLLEKGVLFCRGGQISKKELRRIEAAHAVMLFVTKTCILDADFHQVVNRAVQSGKNILTIYLEDVALDSWGHMQLDSAQALFRYQLSDEEFARKLAEAEVFRNMAVTKQQKQFQKRRGFSLVAIPVLAAALLFTTVVYPLMLAPEKDTPGGIPGLKGLTQEELDQITELHICGDQVYSDVDKVHSWYGDAGNGRAEFEISVENWDTGENTVSTSTTRGSITDLSDLTKLRNLEVLEISGQQITDLTPVFELTKLRRLGVECNPITSIEGIEALHELEELYLSGTDITDLTPIDALPNLRILLAEGTYANQLSTEALARIDCLGLAGTGTRLSYVGEHENYNLSLLQLSYEIRDFSIFRDVKSFEALSCDGAYVSDFMPVLAGIPIGEFNFSGIHDLYSIDQLDGLVITKRLDVCHARSLTSIEGIEKYDGIECICLKDCLGLTDLTPLNNLQNVKVVEVSTPMKPLVEAQISPDACFRIEYRDD